jgi:hypothetical protein
MILFIFSASCVTLPCRECTLEGKTDMKLSKIPFSDMDSGLYRVSIKLYSMYFSGLLAIKKIEKDNFRMSLISETGFKLFDIEIKDGNAEMQNVFAELDRPEVKKTFIKDLTMMVLSGISSNNCNGYVFDKTDDYLYECRIGERFSNNFLIEKKSGTLKKIWEAEDIDEPVFEINFGYDESGSDTPAFITIVHFNVKLRIELSFLEKNNVQK